ncbi:MAG: hypothetical protein JWO67_6481 [Streptosporangiaceae bacterium]|nr:hypothetical protein [Streptosporangiaceae bacterium]
MNEIRPCLGCGQEDNHPRHQVVIPPNQDSVWFHYDCHAAITGCEICVPIAAAAQGKTGDELRDHLMSTSVKG